MLLIRRKLYIILYRTVLHDCFFWFFSQKVIWVCEVISKLIKGVKFKRFFRKHKTTGQLSITVPSKHTACIDESLEYEITAKPVEGDKE